MTDAIFLPLAAQQAVGAAFGRSSRHQRSFVAGFAGLQQTLTGGRRRGDRDRCATRRRGTRGAYQELRHHRTGSSIGRRSRKHRVSIRRNNVIRQETLRVISTQLAELLRLDPRVKLSPTDPSVVPLELVKADSPVGELISQALTCRPELSESRYLVGVAVERMRREQYAMLLPSVILGASYGDYGGGVGGTSFDNSGGRMEADVIAFWEIRNLGLGERAARAEAPLLAAAGEHQSGCPHGSCGPPGHRGANPTDQPRREIPTLQEAVVTAVASQKRNLQRIRKRRVCRSK